MSETIGVWNIHYLDTGRTVNYGPKKIVTSKEDLDKLKELENSNTPHYVVDAYRDSIGLGRFSGQNRTLRERTFFSYSKPLQVEKPSEKAVPGPEKVSESKPEVKEQKTTQTKNHIIPYAPPQGISASELQKEWGSVRPYFENVAENSTGDFSETIKNYVEDMDNAKSREDVRNINFRYIGLSLLKLQEEYTKNKSPNALITPNTSQDEDVLITPYTPNPVGSDSEEESRTTAPRPQQKETKTEPIAPLSGTGPVEKVDVDVSEYLEGYHSSYANGISLKVADAYREALKDGKPVSEDLKRMAKRFFKFRKEAAKSTTLEQYIGKILDETLPVEKINRRKGFAAGGNSTPQYNFQAYEYVRNKIEKGAEPEKVFEDSITELIDAPLFQEPAKNDMYRGILELSKEKGVDIPENFEDAKNKFREET